jgi:mono/diheme cytochrome c family protein
MLKGSSALILLALVLFYPIFSATPQDSAEKLFLDKCAPCHGPQGKGDGPAAGLLTPKPRDFTSGQWKFGGSKEQIIKTISGGSPGTAMQPWKDSLSPKQIEQMAEYALILSQ